MADYRKMRLPRQALTQEEVLDILRSENTGVLATVNEEGNPRATAVNYSVFDNQTLIFHSSKVGEKIDNMRKNPNVSFFVINRDEVLKGEYTTNYRSVSVHGRVEIIEGNAAFPYLIDMTRKIDDSVTDQEIYEATYPHYIGKMAVVLIHIEHLTGKVGERSPEAIKGRKL